MRELTESEMTEVSGAGPFGDARELFADERFIQDFERNAIRLYEGFVNVTSHVIGRVRGDLHPTYYR